MYIFSILKNIFSKKEVSKEEYVIIVRRGYDVILPRDFYDMCKEKGYSITIVFTKNNKPTSVQVHCFKDGERNYIGSVKKMLGVAKFKNKNVCDYTKENIIRKEK